MKYCAIFVSNFPVRRQFCNKNNYFTEIQMGHIHSYLQHLRPRRQLINNPRRAFAHIHTVGKNTLTLMLRFDGAVVYAAGEENYTFLL